MPPDGNNALRIYPRSGNGSYNELVTYDALEITEAVRSLPDNPHRLRGTAPAVLLGYALRNIWEKSGDGSSRCRSCFEIP